MSIHKLTLGIKIKLFLEIHLNMLKKIMAKSSIIKEHSSDTTTLDEVGGKNGTYVCTAYAGIIA